ncbi:hypothetical protein F4859DRAFT_496525 [Xylaria cf. heliscus]|nr:hypothetical protein F4859DRAFT_496525 [Xylaria cf. heliscus]
MLLLYLIAGVYTPTYLHHAANACLELSHATQLLHTHAKFRHRTPRCMDVWILWVYGSHQHSSPVRSCHIAQRGMGEQKRT